MQKYFLPARENCWKLYLKYYQNSEYKHHEERYRETIEKHLGPDISLLDAGCGSEMRFASKFLQKTRLSVGVDLGEMKVRGSVPYAVRADLCKLPFKDGSFDVIISLSVMEHLVDPTRAFREFSRILKPKGIVVIQTPNKYDYVSIIARFTPFWFHRWVLSRLLGRDEEDTFPTFFRANTTRQIVSFLNRSKLTPLSISLSNQYPAYFMFSPLLFRVGVLYERLTSRYAIFSQLRGWILAVAQKYDNLEDEKFSSRKRLPLTSPSTGEKKQ